MYGVLPDGSDFGLNNTPQSVMNGGVDPVTYSSAATVQGSRLGNEFHAQTGMAIDATSSLQDGQPGQTGHQGHQHRLSVGSSGPFTGLARQSSLGASETTSPDLQNFATDTFGLDSNDVTNSQSVNDPAKTEETLDLVAPAWSELKTKAGKERKRLPLACIACRRKKIRCSGEKPACKHCLRSRIPCVYKVTTRKAAPRTDYMAMLDKRLKRMEDRVIKTIPKEEQNIVNSTGRAVLKPALPAAPPKATSSSKKRAADQAFGNELGEWAAGEASGSATKQKPSSSKDGAPKTKESDEQNLLLEGADKLPTKEIQEHLAEVFFDYVYGQSYHLLHKPSFMRKLGQGAVPPVLTLAVCAISARFSNHPSVRTDPAFLRGENWASAARDIALRRYDTPNITILIVYLILGLHEFGTCQGGRSWMFGGMAQRMAYALQLHKDLDHDPKDRSQSEKIELTPTDREIRRRTMWSCFLMDRFNSSGTDRPIFVGEQYIRAQLPVKENFYHMEISGPTEDLEGNVPNPVEPGTGQMADAKENMGVAAHLIRLVSIWGRLISYLNLGGQERDEHPLWSEESKFRSIRRATEEWKRSLPASMQHTAENLQNYASERIANQFLFLHIVYYQILLFMNRFALPIPGSRQIFPKEMPEQFIAEAGRTAVEAANQISALVHDAMDHLVVAPFAGYCAFYSSTVHIHGAFSKNPQLEALSKQNLAWNVKYLTKMKKYWGMFHFVTENLRDLYRRHADAARSGGTAGKEGDNAIFQYGDWFDRYPHGVSGTDYEEPSAEVKREPGSDAVLGQKSDLQTVEEFFSKLSTPNNRVAPGQPQAVKKPAKKRHLSKSEGSKTAQAAQQQSNVPPSDENNAQQSAAPSQQPVVHDLTATQAFQNNNIGGFPQQAAAFSQGFHPQHIPSAMSSQPFMSQLDRQMVLNSYANQGLAPNMDATMMDLASTAGLENFDMNNWGNNMDQNSNGFWGDPSTAWFMPFNMDPPVIGDDTFGGNMDWSNNFGGFGDMAGIPTGLTPRLEGENGGDQNSAGQTGLDSMQ